MLNYMFTVIIPIYNTEEYLHKALQSLKKQTIGFENLEIIIVDDGSTDNSCIIGERFRSENSNVKFFKTQHKGVSEARNIGIRNAKGKYIMFLDGDDQLDTNTAENIFNFFAENYHYVDLVTYPLKSYKDSVDGELLPDHYRYQFLRESGVYDLEHYPYITQTTMNIVIKNKFKNNVYFRTNMKFTEDQAFCFDILLDKFKIGFCREGEYKYVRHTRSSSSSLMGAIYLYEQCMGFWEELFYNNIKENGVSKYIQAAYVNDLSWKNVSNILYPYHYREEKKFKNAVNRIKRLLTFVDDDIILGHPGIDEFHKYYFLEMKGKENYTVIHNKDSISLCRKRLIVKQEKDVELVVEKVGFINDVLIIRGYFASVLFNFVENIVFYEKTKGSKIEKRKLKTFIGAKSWHKCHTKTNSMWAFETKRSNLNDVQELEFSISINGVEMPIKLRFEEDTVFYERAEMKMLISGDICVSIKENKFLVKKLGKQEIRQYLKQEIKYYESIQPDVAYIRKHALEYKEKRIWLYYDSKGVYEDNGFKQFLADCRRKDSVERYYVTQNDLGYYRKKYLRYSNNIIEFGKHKHQILFLNCEKIITGYIENYNLIPFSKVDYGRVADVINTEVIYLQHGILHADAPWKYTYLGNIANRVVISTNYEKDLFRRLNYPQDSLICTGMPRYDKKYINVKKSEKIILYAPSWRAYLATLGTRGTWEGNREKLFNSKFYLGIRSIFESEKLITILQKHEIKMIIQLHPIFDIYHDEFATLENESIQLAKKNGCYDECCMFVTDYSSYVFDFVRKKKYISYYFVDEEEFYTGLNGYYRLSLPLEEGFGNICNTIEELEYEIEKAVSNNFLPDEKYASKMEGFFFENDQICDQIYREIVNYK